MERWDWLMQEQELAKWDSVQSLDSAGLSPPVGQCTLSPAGHQLGSTSVAQTPHCLHYPCRASLTHTSNTLWQVCACGSASSWCW